MWRLGLDKEENFWLNKVSIYKGAQASENNMGCQFFCFAKAISAGLTDYAIRHTTKYGNILNYTNYTSDLI